MSEIFENLMGDFSTQWKYLPVAFVKYTSLQLYSYCTWNSIFLVLLETVETLVLRWLFSSSKCSYMCLLFCPKNSKTSSRKNSTTQKWLIVESCLDKWHFDALSIDQFARIHTSSLINIEKILNRPITEFYNGDDVNMIAAELCLTKTRRTSFDKKQSFIRNNVTDVNKVLKTKC